MGGFFFQFFFYPRADFFHGNEMDVSPLRFPRRSIIDDCHFFFLYFSGCFFFHRTFFNEFIFVCFYLGYVFLLFIICEIMEGGVFPYWLLPGVQIFLVYRKGFCAPSGCI